MLVPCDGLAEMFFVAGNLLADFALHTIFFPGFVLLLTLIKGQSSVGVGWVTQENLPHGWRQRRDVPYFDACTLCLPMSCQGC